MATIGTLVARITGDVSGLARAERQARSHLSAIDRSARKTEDVFKSLRRTVMAAFAAVGVGKLSQSLVDAASSAERLQTQLDVLTGHGKQMFDVLNKWASQMPVNTEQAIAIFKRLQAYGLKPTTEMMTTLVDASLALTGNTEGMERIALALGQMAAKGKVSAEELLQLTETGYSATEVLRKQFHLTAKEMDNLAKAFRERGIEVGQVIEVILADMEKRFGGMAAAMNDKWVGIVNRMHHQWWNFRRLIMESGPFQALEKGLVRFLRRLESAKGQMDLARWAKNAAEGMLTLASVGVKGAGYLTKAFLGLKLIVVGVELAFWKFVDRFKEGIQSILVTTSKVFSKLAWGALEAGHTSIARGLAAMAKAASSAAVKIEGAGAKVSELSKEWNETLDQLNKADKTLGKVDTWLVKVREDARGIRTEVSNTTSGVKEEAKGHQEILDRVDKIRQSLKDEAIAYYDQLETTLKLKLKLAELNGDHEKQIELQKQLLRIELERKLASGEYKGNEELLIKVYEKWIETLGKTKPAVDELTEYIKNRWKDMMDSIQDTISDTFYDVLQGQMENFGDFLDRLKDAFLRTIADIAAYIAMQRIVLPVVVQVVPGGIPGIGGSASLGGSLNIPGLGFIGNFLRSPLPTWLGGAGAAAGGWGTASASSVYGPSFASNIPGVGMGPTWGGLLTAAGLGSFGYSTIGGMIGLPQSRYSGLTAGAGAGIGFAVGGPIGAGVGALLGGIGGGLLGGHHRFPHYNISLGTKLPGQPVPYIEHSWHEYGLREGLFWSRERHIPEEIGPALDEWLVDYFTDFAQTLDRTLGVSVEDAIREIGGRRFTYESLEKLIEQGGDWQGKLVENFTKQFFEAYGNNLLEQIGVATDVIDVGVIEQLQQPGEKLADTFVRVVKELEVIPSATEHIRDIMERSGETAVQAFKEFESIAEFGSQLVAQPVHDAIVKALRGADWTDIGASLTRSIENAIADALTQSAATRISSMIVDQLFNQFAGLQELISKIMSGNVSESDIAGVLDDFNEKLPEVTDAMRPVIEGLAELIGSFYDLGEATRGLVVNIRSMAYSQEELARADIERLSAKYSIDLSQYKFSDWREFVRSIEDFSDWTPEMLEDLQQLGRDYQALDQQTSTLSSTYRGAAQYATDASESTDRLIESLQSLIDTRTPVQKALDTVNAMNAALGASIQTFDQFVDYVSGLNLEDLSQEQLQGLLDLGNALRTLAEDAERTRQAVDELSASIYQLATGRTSAEIALERLGAEHPQWASMFPDFSAWQQYTLSDEFKNVFPSLTPEQLQDWYDYGNALKAVNNQLEQNLQTAKSQYIDALQREISSYEQAQRQLEQNFERAKSAYVDALQAEINKKQEAISAAEQTVSAYDDLIKSIRDYRDELLTSSNALMPDIQYKMARAQLEAAVRGLYSGDDKKVQESLQKLPGLSDKFLQASLAANTDFRSYMRDFGKVMTILNTSEGVAKAHKSTAEQQLDELKDQTQSLQDILDSLQGPMLTLAEARNNYLEAKNELDNSVYPQLIQHDKDILAQLQGPQMTLDQARNNYLEAQNALLGQMLDVLKGLGASRASGGHGGGGGSAGTGGGSTSAGGGAGSALGSSHIEQLIARVGGRDVAEQMVEVLNKGGAKVVGKWAREHGFTVGDIQEIYNTLEGTHYGSDVFKEALGMAQGGTLIGPTTGYTAPVTFHGVEHIVPDTRMGEVAETLSEVKELLIEIRNTNGEQHKVNRKLYRILDRVSQGEDYLRTKVAA